MSSQDVLKEVKEVIRDTIPASTEISEIEFEGPEIAVYCRNPQALLDNDNIVKNLAKKIRKRIVIRSDPVVRLAEDKTRVAVAKIVPEEAEITEINFDENVGEIVIEAKKPGLVIGRNGATLKEIVSQVHWRPRVIRTPPIKSQLISQIRAILQADAAKRKTYLREIGHRIHRPIISRNQWIRFTALGGFREVGREAMLIETSESKVLIDCGVNVGNPQHAFPFLDIANFSVNTIDAVVVTHAHLDHSGFVPYLYKWGYQGPVYCTPATRNLMTLLCLDYLDVAEHEGKLLPYSQKDVKAMVLRNIVLDYGEVTDIAPDVRLTLHNAGHILGSAIAHLHIGDGLYNLAYTGDFKYGRTRLLEPATANFPRLETLIMESTYGASGDITPNYKNAELKIIRAINSTIKRGGKVLIPVLAVGRAQEIMLVIEDAMRKKSIPSLPIYVDGMISEATAIHTTHPELLNRSLQDKIFHQGHNPFLAEYFVQVENANARTDIINGDSCIILATSGMMNGGPSVEYFRHLGDDPKNGLIFVSYQAEGTLGRRIQKGWKEVTIRTREGQKERVQVNLQTATADGFSGHSDRRQLIQYIRRVSPKPERIIFCHGESSKCQSLAHDAHKILRIPTIAPMNLETIRLR